jgi:hypothetical protein
MMVGVALELACAHWSWIVPAVDDMTSVPLALTPIRLPAPLPPR